MSTPNPSGSSQSSSSACGKTNPKAINSSNTSIGPVTLLSELLCPLPRVSRAQVAPVELIIMQPSGHNNVAHSSLRREVLVQLPRTPVWQESSTAIAFGLVMHVTVKAVEVRSFTQSTSALDRLKDSVDRTLITPCTRNLDAWILYSRTIASSIAAATTLATMQT